MNASSEAIPRKTALFANLIDVEMQALAARVTRKRFQKDEQLFTEGDSCTGLYLVAAGPSCSFRFAWL